MCKTQQIIEQLEVARTEVTAAQDEARQAAEMVEELLEERKKGQGEGKLLEVVGQLQTQLESQRGMLGKYEPRLKKKEKEVKQLRADTANAQLEVDKMKRHLGEVNVGREEVEGRLAEASTKVDEWKDLADLLQKQLEEKSDEVEGREEEMAQLREDLDSAKSRVLLFKNEAESKEEQLEVLQETLDELKSKGKNSSKGEENGWNDDGEEQVGVLE